MEIPDSLLDLNKICRLCLTEETVMSSIYSEGDTQSSSVPLPLRIMACVSIEVSSSDGLPSQICATCLCQVDGWYKFKDLCENADLILRKCIKNEPIQVENIAHIQNMAQEVKKYFTSSEVKEEIEQSLCQTKSLGQKKKMEMAKKQAINKEEGSCMLSLLLQGKDETFVKSLQWKLGSGDRVADNALRKTPEKDPNAIDSMGRERKKKISITQLDDFLGLELESDKMRNWNMKVIHLDHDYERNLPTKEAQSPKAYHSAAKECERVREEMGSASEGDRDEDNYASDLEKTPDESLKKKQNQPSDRPIQKSNYETFENFEKKIKDRFAVVCSTKLLSESSAACPVEAHPKESLIASSTPLSFGSKKSPLKRRKDSTGDFLTVEQKNAVVTISRIPAPGPKAAHPKILSAGSGNMPSAKSSLSAPNTIIVTTISKSSLTGPVEIRSKISSATDNASLNSLLAKLKPSSVTIAKSAETRLKAISSKNAISSSAISTTGDLKTSLDTISKSSAKRSLIGFSAKTAKLSSGANDLEMSSDAILESCPETDLKAYSAYNSLAVSAIADLETCSGAILISSPIPPTKPHSDLSATSATSPSKVSVNANVKPSSYKKSISSPAKRKRKRLESSSKSSQTPFTLEFPPLPLASVLERSSANFSTTQSRTLPDASSGHFLEPRPKKHSRKTRKSSSKICQTPYSLEFPPMPSVSSLKPPLGDVSITELKLLPIAPAEPNRVVASKAQPKMVPLTFAKGSQTPFSFELSPIPSPSESSADVSFGTPTVASSDPIPEVSSPTEQNICSSGSHPTALQETSSNEIHQNPPSSRQRRKKRKHRGVAATEDDIDAAMELASKRPERIVRKLPRKKSKRPIKKTVDVETDSEQEKVEDIEILEDENEKGETQELGIEKMLFRYRLDDENKLDLVEIAEKSEEMEKPGRPPEGRLHKCLFCRKVHRNRDLYDKHVRRRHLDFLVCKVCDKQLFSIRHFLLHQSTHLSLYAYSCEICGKCFPRGRTYKDHLKIHNSEKEHECSVCQKKFRDRQTLKKHTIIHQDVAYICELCGFCSKYRRHLEDHVRKHNAARDYMCELCGKRFTTPKVMEGHMKTHNPNYPCPFCKKGFRRPDKFELHLSKVHGEKLE